MVALVRTSEYWGKNLLSTSKSHISHGVLGIAARASVPFFFSLLFSAQAQAQSGKITFEQALLTAISNDLTLASQREKLRAAQSGLEAASALPPPTLGMSLNNVPVDSFSFDQEAMTQGMLSFSQKLPPRGLLVARELTQQQAVNIASAESELRRAQLAQTLNAAWIDGWQADATTKILDRHQAHFEQMVSAADASFRAGLRRSSQRDVLALRTALSRLTNRRQMAITRLTVAQESFREWLDTEQLAQLDFSAMPAMTKAEFARESSNVSQHPAIQLAQFKQQKSNAETTIAEAMGRSGRAVSVSYGHREASANGVSRSDFISIGFSMELTALRRSANKSRIGSAQAKSDQSMREKQQIEQRLHSDLISKLAIKAQVEKQLELYAGQIIPQSQQQAELTRAAYRSDEATFKDMQRTQIDLMSVELEDLDLRRQRLMIINALQYISSTVNDTQGEAQ